VICRAQCSSWHAGVPRIFTDRELPRELLEAATEEDLPFLDRLHSSRINLSIRHTHAAKPCAADEPVEANVDSSGLVD
jgi:hypothetical protein